MASFGRLDFFSSFDSICRLLSEDIFAGFEMRHAGVEVSTPGASRASSFLSKPPQNPLADAQSEPYRALANAITGNGYRQTDTGQLASRSGGLSRNAAPLTSCATLQKIAA